MIKKQVEIIIGIAEEEFVYKILIRELVGTVITIINNERIFVHHPCCYRVSCQRFYQHAIVLTCFLTVRRAESTERDYIDNDVDEFLNTNNTKQHPRFDAWVLR